METWGGEPGYIGDLPITDIRFYDAMNRFNPNNLDKIKKFLLLIIHLMKVDVWV